jgi:hypothetical protein
MLSCCNYYTISDSEIRRVTDKSARALCEVRTASSFRTGRRLTTRLPETCRSQRGKWGKNLPFTLPLYLRPSGGWEVGRWQSQSPSDLQ